MDFKLNIEHLNFDRLKEKLENLEFKMFCINDSKTRELLEVCHRLPKNFSNYYLINRLVEGKTVHLIISDNTYTFRKVTGSNNPELFTLVVSTI